MPGLPDALIDVIASLVVVLDEDGRIVRFNRAAERLLGYAASEVLGRKPWELLLDPACATAVASYFQPFDPAGILERYECDWIGKDGSAHRVVWTNAVVPDPSGRQLVVGTGVDVTAQRQQEARLRASEARLAATLEHAPVGIAVLEPDFAWIQLNGRLCSILGYEREELLRLTRHDVTYPEDRAADEVHVRRLLAGEIQSYALEKRYVRKDGSLVWAAVTVAAVPGAAAGRPFCVAIVDDITERRAAAAALRQHGAERERTLAALCDSESKFRATFENALGFVALLETDGTVLSCNRTAAAFAGIDQAEAVGRPLWRGPWLAHDDAEADRIRRAIHECAAAGQVVRFETTHVDAAGTVHEIDFSVKPVRDAAGRPFLILAEGRDVSDIRRAEREKRELAEQLLHAQKMESIGRLAGSVAHDFNNLLTAVVANVGMARADATGEQAEALDDALHAARSGVTLTSRLLAFSRRQIVEPRVVDLNGAVRGARKLLERLVGEDVRIDYELASALPPIRIDPGQLEQALINLAVNARDAMPGGGALRIETYVRDCTRPQHPACVSKGGTRCVVLAVTDSGTGMTEEVRAHLFEPFFTTKPPGQGTGLGLATVYGVVAQNRGYIEVFSEEGRGSRFEITLPVAEGTPEAVRGTIDSAPAPGVGQRVMLVEDQDLVRATAVRVLEANGYQVTPFADAPSALDALRAGAPADVLVTDVRMPGMHGDELADAAQDARPGLHVLFVSGYPDQGGRGGLDLHRRGRDFLAKPFTPAALATAVERALSDHAP